MALYDCYSFPEDYQDSLLACIIAHPHRFMPYVNILNSTFFTSVARVATARALFNYWRDHQRFPSWSILEQVIYDSIVRTAEEKQSDIIDKYIKRLRDQDTGDVESIAQHTIGFAKRRALYLAIDHAATEFEAGNVPEDGFIPLFEDALKVGFNTAETQNAIDLAEAKIDPNDTLLGKRFLRREGGLLFAASAGSGKSTAANQMVIAWACGREAIGIKPSKPLKIFVVQAEDDSADCRDMAISAVYALRLTPEEQELVKQNTVYIRECAKTGEDFIGWLNAQVYHHRPDLIVINPLLSFIGGKGVLDAATCTKFLRHGINPILLRYKCGVLLIHHTPKTNTAQRDTSKWKATDWVYAAAGSAEIANWCRAALIIDSTHDNFVFKFVAAKRGRRVGWKDHFLDPVQVRYFRQSKEKLRVEEDETIDLQFWEDATDNDIARAQAADDEARKPGPSKGISDAALLKPLRDATAEGQGLTQATWLELLQEAQVKISQPGLSKRCKQLRASGRVRAEKSLWFYVDKEGNEP